MTTKSAKITVLDVTHTQLLALRKQTGLSMAEIVRQALRLWEAQRTPTGTRQLENAEYRAMMAEYERQQMDEWQVEP